MHLRNEIQIVSDSLSSDNRMDPQIDIKMTLL